MSLASFCWLWFGPSVAFPACSISMALTCSLLYLFFFFIIIVRIIYKAASSSSRWRLKEKGE
jgi:hypothetical protein